MTHSNVVPHPRHRFRTSLTHFGFDVLIPCQRLEEYILTACSRIGSPLSLSRSTRLTSSHPSIAKMKMFSPFRYYSVMVYAGNCGVYGSHSLGCRLKISKIMYAPPHLFGGDRVIFLEGLPTYTVGNRQVVHSTQSDVVKVLQNGVEQKIPINEKK